MYFIASSFGGYRSFRRVAWFSVLGLLVGRPATCLYSRSNAMHAQVPNLPVSNLLSRTGYGHLYKPWLARLPINDGRPRCYAPGWRRRRPVAARVR